MASQYPEKLLQFFADVERAVGQHGWLPAPRQDVRFL